MVFEVHLVLDSDIDKTIGVRNLELDLVARRGDNKSGDIVQTDSWMGSIKDEIQRAKSVSGDSRLTVLVEL